MFKLLKNLFTEKDEDKDEKELKDFINKFYSFFVLSKTNNGCNYLGGINFYTTTFPEIKEQLEYFFVKDETQEYYLFECAFKDIEWEELGNEIDLAKKLLDVCGIRYTKINRTRVGGEPFFELFIDKHSGRNLLLDI